MRASTFCLLLFVSSAFARAGSAVAVEYTKEVVQEGVANLALCYTPGCNTVYTRKTGWYVTQEMEDAFAFIDAKGCIGIRECPRAFEFVRLYNMSVIPVQKVKLGTRTVQQEHCELVTKQVPEMRWRPL